MNQRNLLSAESHFAFGKNWLDYARKIDEPKIAQAITDLQRLSGRERFDGLSFLDIGCGSGLHSLAAVRMGADRVVGVDIDADSVAASRDTLARFAPQADTRFERVSVFDMQPEDYGGFDLVYSWGVLHHTGDMYRALTSAAALVQPQGILMVALYRKTRFCGMWRMIKQWYSAASPAAQVRARKAWIGVQRVMFRLTGRDHAAYVRDYGRGRGMDYFNDVHDWMGGYPYESISPQHCRQHFEQLGFVVQHDFSVAPKSVLSGLMGSGCDEFAFRKLG
ncbi:class I SAM-dependent methyltransferase [Pseudoxanthomonas koreensis]|uniref:class I SAM-dependent methyltransferase n=1 Tax=Pseudoxanthomonas koreensis TaxID=266061 RepID=UPI0035A5D156